MTDDEILDQIGRERQKTIAIYHGMAALTDAKALGWVVREPGQPDVTLALIRAALRDNQTAARDLLRQVAENDRRVTALTQLLIEGRS